MEKVRTQQPAWLNRLKSYETPSLRKALIQIGTTVIPYLVLMTVMFLLLNHDFPYWQILLVAVLTAGLYTRVFIIFHDCCHYSFFKSRRACEIVGNFCGILTFTSYNDWQRSHNIHHANVANLDRRGTGDVWTMTVREYEEAGKWERLQYRVMRNPLFLFGVAPAFLFLVLNRFPGSSSRRKEIINLLLTNSLIAGMLVLIYFTIGLKNYALIQAPVLVIGSTFGMWLFYIQHQYQNVYWAHDRDWDLFRAAMEGSSYYKLQAVLRWLSGNIGYHHIHHLRPKIPNYNLKQCYDDISELREITPITLLASFKSLSLRLWDEKTRQLVSFASLRNKK